MMINETKDFRIIPAWAEEGDVSEIDMGNGEISIFVPTSQSKDAGVLEGETIVYDTARFPGGHFIMESFPGPEFKHDLVSGLRNNGYVVPDIRHPRTIVALDPISER